MLLIVLLLGIGQLLMWAILLGIGQNVTRLQNRLDDLEHQPPARAIPIPAGYEVMIHEPRKKPRTIFVAGSDEGAALLELMQRGVDPRHISDLRPLNGPMDSGPKTAA